MIYLHDIVAFINDTIKSRVTSYPAAVYHGIATYGYKATDQSFITFPTIVGHGKNGAADIGFNTNVPFVAYHRIGLTSFSIVPGKSYGDGEEVAQRSVTEVQMMVRGNRNLINSNPEQLAMVIADSMPSNFNMQGSVRIEGSVVSVGIQYDSRANFNQEYTGVTYNIGPDGFFISIRYRIEGSYLKGCTNKCEC